MYLFSNSHNPWKEVSINTKLSPSFLTSLLNFSHVQKKILNASVFEGGPNSIFFQNVRASSRIVTKWPKKKAKKLHLSVIRNRNIFQNEDKFSEEKLLKTIFSECSKFLMSSIFILSYYENWKKILVAIFLPLIFLKKHQFRVC